MSVRFSFVLPLCIGLACLGLVLCGCQNEQASSHSQNTHSHSEGRDHLHDGDHQHATHSHDGDKQSEEFDPHDIPITENDVKRPADFKDAVARIKKYRDDIEAGAAGDTPGLAHRPLDELNFVLQWLPGIARDSNVPKEHWEAINTTANGLRELFEKVHQNIDNIVDPDFASVEKQIDEGIGRLQAITDSEPAAEQAAPDE